MNKIFKYCLLNYRPSYVLGEQVNIGILFLFADDNQVVFEFPNRLQRLTALFPNVDLNYIRKHLLAFQSKSKKLSKKNLFVAQQFNNEELINNEFLIADANSFFFLDWKVGNYSDIDKTVTHFKNQYFANYQSLDDKSRKDDDYLLKQFSEQIKGESNAAFFQKNKKIEFKGFDWDFDLCWQNGTTNLVRSLSFDLKNKDYFIDKARKHFGAIAQLQMKGYDVTDKCFDFLVVRPSDQSLFKVYDNAIQILDGVPTKHRIIEENNLNNYISEAINTVKSIDIGLFAQTKSIGEN